MAAQVVKIYSSGIYILPYGSNFLHTCSRDHGNFLINY